MMCSLRIVAASIACACLVMGCSSGADGDLKLAPVTGTVTYGGGPLAGATVVFMPEKGPLAMGVTDTKGEFKLASGSLVGCAVGPCMVSVKIGTAGQDSSTMNMTPGAVKTPEEQQAWSKKMAEMTQTRQTDTASKPKSLIPERYLDAKTSGLQFTVETDAAKNNFKIDLKD